mmetsp:Transcript_7152/g.12879  ORF Transcript_7152/g.12879 Transcript_7152/m.12879 type:complete len:96 (-) Transcript_7152:529-816(-)
MLRAGSGQRHADQSVLVWMARDNTAADKTQISAHRLHCGFCSGINSTTNNTTKHSRKDAVQGQGLAQRNPSVIRNRYDLWMGSGSEWRILQVVIS